MTADGLFDMPGHAAGRHEKALQRAIEDAKARGVIEEVDDGLVSLALANATALDSAERSGKPAYPIAQITGGYLDVLRALAITPEGRVTDADAELRQALEDLGSAEVRDPAT